MAQNGPRMKRTGKHALGLLYLLLSAWFRDPASAQRTARHSKLLEAQPEARGSSGETQNGCAALNTPKVAMLFLTVAEIAHEPTWKLWFQEAAGLVPASALKAHPDQTEQCDAQKLQAAREHCFAQPNAGVLQSQILFSVYVHAAPEFDDFPADSIFRGRVIKERIKARRCTQDIVLAERNLLTEALRDALNQRFILLSESCLPLYPPQTLYMQLMSEQKSRLESCPRERFPWTAGLRMGHQLRKAWRKGSQWFALIRKHAELVHHHNLMHTFHKHCTCQVHSGMHRLTDCFPDEHFMHTVIALENLADETDCIGRLTNVDWWRADGAHPREYEDWELTPDLFHYLRYWEETPCDPEAAISSSRDAFVDVRSVEAANLNFYSNAGCSGAGYNGTALSSGCPLLARKFPKILAGKIANMFGQCGFDLKVVGMHPADVPVCEKHDSAGVHEVEIHI